MDVINMLALAIIIACGGLIFVVLRAFILVHTIQIQTRQHPRRIQERRPPIEFVRDGITFVCNNGGLRDIRTKDGERVAVQDSDGVIRTVRSGRCHRPVMRHLYTVH